MQVKCKKIIFLCQMQPFEMDLSDLIKSISTHQYAFATRLGFSIFANEQPTKSWS
jgi:hypothetical protein